MVILSKSELKSLSTKNCSTHACMKKNLSGVQGNYTQKYKYAYKISVLLEQYSKITKNSIRFIVTGNYERNYYKLIKIY